MNIWISCDLHLYCVEPDERHPFRTRRNLGQLSDNFASDISQEDVWIFLGDLCDPGVADKDQMRKIIQSIPCRKYMCRGNHDTEDDIYYLELGFTDIGDIIRYHNIIFSHKPCHVAPDEVNIHGHLHTQVLSNMGPNHINAYASNWNDGEHPVLLEDLIDSAIVQDLETTQAEQSRIQTQYEKYTSLFGDTYAKFIDITDAIDEMPIAEAANKEQSFTNPTLLYHGSSSKFKVLKAFPSPAYPDQARVFATPSYKFALAFAGKQWSDLEINQSTVNGEQVLTEILPGMFEEKFNCPGYVHVLEPDGFEPFGRDMEWVCPHDVPVSKVDCINNVLAEMKRQKVRMYKYPDLPPYIRSREKYIRDIIAKYNMDTTYEQLSSRYNLSEAAIGSNHDDMLDEILAFNEMMHTFNYGLRIKGVWDPKRNTTAADWDKYLRVQSPKEFEQSRVGVCWDYVTYEAQYFKDHFPKVKYKCWYIVINGDDDMPTHTFLTFIWKNKVYLFESSFGYIKGVWSARSEKDVVDFILDSMNQYDRNLRGKALDCTRYVCNYNALDPTIPGMGCMQYMNYMADKGIDYEYEFNLKYKISLVTASRTIHETVTTDPTSREDMLSEILFQDSEDTKYWMADSEDYPRKVEKAKEQKGNTVVTIDELSIGSTSKHHIKIRLVHTPYQAKVNRMIRDYRSPINPEDIVLVFQDIEEMSQEFRNAMYQWYDNQENTPDGFVSPENPTLVHIRQKQLITDWGRFGITFDMIVLHECAHSVVLSIPGAKDRSSSLHEGIAMYESGSLEAYLAYRRRLHKMGYPIYHTKDAYQVKNIISQKGYPYLVNILKGSIKEPAHDEFMDGFREAFYNEAALGEIPDRQVIDEVVQEKIQKCELVFLSTDSDWDENVIHPRIPDNYMTQNGFEDAKTPRVCFSTSISKALRAMSQDCTGMEFCVYVPGSNDYKVVTPTKKQVPDVDLTDERWILEPVVLYRAGKIKVLKASKNGLPYIYGNNQKAELYDWTWKWIERDGEDPTSGKVFVVNEATANKYPAITAKTKKSTNPNDGVSSAAVRVTFFNDQKKEIGMAAASAIDTDTAFLYDVEVYSAYRGKGYGNSIMKFMMDHYPITELTVEKSNKVAISLYKKFGFKKAMDFKENGKDMIDMKTAQAYKEQQRGVNEATTKRTNSSEDIHTILNSLSAEESNHVGGGYWVDSDHVIFRKVEYNKGIPIGFVDVYNLPKFKRLGLIVFAVTEKARGKGVGRRLIQAAIAGTRNNKSIDGLRWLADNDNSVSIHMATACGFTHMGDAPDDCQEFIYEFPRKTVTESADDTVDHTLTKKDKTDLAKKYGLTDVGNDNEYDDEKELAEMKRKEADRKAKKALDKKKKARDKQLKNARSVKKRKAFFNKVKSSLPGVKKEEASAVDNDDIDWTDGGEYFFRSHTDQKKFIQESYSFQLVDKVQFMDRLDEAAQKNSKYRPVYIIIMHTGTTLSNIIKTAINSTYSHASISFDSSLKNMYSFARKLTDDGKHSSDGGFRKEDINNPFFKDKEIKFSMYMVPCTEDQIKLMKKRLDYFQKNQSKFTYDFTGLVKSFFRISDNPEYKWFCTRFVADILNSGRPNDPYIKDPFLVRPDDFMKTNFAMFVTSGYLDEYDQKEVDKTTKRLLNQKKVQQFVEDSQNEMALDLPYGNPYERHILNFQLSKMDEAAVDNFLMYLKSFKVRFDANGDIRITRREFDQLDSHFRSSLKLIKACEGAGNVEGVKEELYKIHYMIELINQYYLKPYAKNYRPNTKEVRKDMMDLRAVMMNAFKQHLEWVTLREPRYNFQRGYQVSIYGSETKIPHKVATHVGKTITTMLV